MKLKPLFDYVLIRPLEADSKTASGILLPDSAKEAPQMGEIIEVGPGAYDDGKQIPMEVKKGQKVLYKKWGGEDVKVDGEELKLVKQIDVVAIVEK
jgi:chaperonin GroES